jgi:hypothetical protein
MQIVRPNVVLFSEPESATPPWRKSHMIGSRGSELPKCDDPYLSTASQRAVFGTDGMIAAGIDYVNGSCDRGLQADGHQHEPRSPSCSRRIRR